MKNHKTNPDILNYIRLWETSELSQRRMAETWKKLSPSDRQAALRMTRHMTYDDLPVIERSDSEEVTDVDIVITPQEKRRIVG